MTLVPCACGCGIELYPYNNPRRIRKYLHGHGFKGRHQSDKVKRIIAQKRSGDRKLEIRERSAYERAERKFDYDGCVACNQDCKGELHLHHIDSNPFNNSRENIVCLCVTHHRLMHNRGYTLEKLKIPLNYYVDRGGKRRYNHQEPFIGLAVRI
jgi:hypothetical protein